MARTHFPIAEDCADAGNGHFIPYQLSDTRQGNVGLPTASPLHLLVGSLGHRSPPALRIARRLSADLAGLAGLKVCPYFPGCFEATAETSRGDGTTTVR
jgi:hypothetical protein